jgi:fibronectin-binding autotransporter adhesin
MAAVLGLGLCGGAAMAAFVPSDIPGLQLWFDAGDLTGLGPGNNPAAGTAVGTWADLGTSGLDATQGTAARQPIYRSTVTAMGYMPAVDFNGSSQSMVTAAFSSGLVRTAFVVTAPKASPQTTRYPWIVAQVDSSYGANDAWGIRATTVPTSPEVFDNFQASWRHAAAGHGTSTDSSNFSANTPYVLSYVSDTIGNTGTLYVNGNAKPAGTTVHQTVNKALGIGSSSDSAGQWYNGHIAEIILYDTALSAADRAQVEAYLTQKYMTAPLYYDLSSDAGLQGGSRTWTASNALWSSGTAGTDPAAWTDGTNAVFHSTLTGGGFTVTVGEDVRPGFVHVNRGDITFTSGGGRIDMTGGMVIDAAGTAWITINSGVLGGTGGLIFNRSGSNQRIHGGQSFTGQVQLAGGTLRVMSLANFGQNSSFGQGTVGTPILLGSPGETASIWIDEGTHTTNRTFYVAEGGAASIGTVNGQVNLNGVISGGSDMSMMAFNMQGTGVYSVNAQNTYLGTTRISGNPSSNQGVVRLGVSNALPTTTTVQLGNLAHPGYLDLNGNNQELAGLVKTSSSTAPDSWISVFNSNSTTQSTLTLNVASGTNTYVGRIGRGATENNLALVKTGEGILELSGANSYTGTTAVRNGTLRIGADNALPTSTTVTLGLAGSDNPGLLDLNGFDQQLAGLVRTGLSAAETNVFNSDTTTESTLTLNIASGTNTFDGVVGRAGGDNLGLTKTGAGQLQLSGANTYTGATTIAVGTLRTSVLANFGMPSTLGRGTAGVPIVLGSAGGNQGTIWYTGGNVATDRTFHVATGGSGSIGAASGSITLNGGVGGGSATSNMRFSSQGSSTMTLNAASTYVGTTHIYGASNVNSGVVRLGIDNALPTTTSLSLGFNSGSTPYSGLLDLNGFNQQLAGLVRQSGATSSYLNVYNSNTTTQSILTLNIASGTNTYDGVIGRAGGNNLAVVKAGGGRLDLLGANTYTGATTIAAGVLAANSLANFGEPGSLGQGTVGTPVILGSASGAEGVLWYTGGSVATDRTFRIAAGGSGSIRSQAADVTLNGAVDGGSAASRMQFSAQGSSTMTLNAANTYLGSTHIYGAINADAGVVRLGTDHALPTSTNLRLGLNSGGNLYSGLLDLNGFNQQLAGLTRESGATSPHVHVFNSSSTQSTLTLNIASGTNTYDGVIGRAGGNNLALVKTGEGILELSGANTYSGATAVQNGTLRIGAHNALPTSTSVTLGLAGSDNFGLLDLNEFDQQLAGLVRTGLAAAETNVFNSDTTTESTLTLNIASGINTFAGVIGRDGGDYLGLTKTGGGQLALSGVNTYTGATTISRGVMRTTVLANFGVPSSLGKGSEGVPIVLGSAGGNLGSIWHTGGNMTTNRTFHLADGGIGSIGTNSGSITLNGVIEGGSATSLMRLSSQATHVMTLNAQSTYMGATHIYGAMNANNGIVRLGIDNALPVMTSLSLGFVSSSNQYAGLFDLNGFNQELAGLVRESGTSPYLNVYNSNTTTQSTLTLNIASGTNVYDGVIGRAGGNNLALVKRGEGAFELLRDNTYAGTTIVEAGLLSVPGSLANIGPADIHIHSAGTTFGANDPRIELAVGNGSGYGMGSAIAGGDFATTAELLGGTAGADRTVAMAWRQGASGEKGTLISDVLSLEGSGDDTYVLHMSYDPNWGASAYLAWLDGDGWVNAVAGNTGGTPMFFDAAYDPAEHFTLGYHGVDTANHFAWAVLNHNSQFAVVPEPGTALMLLAGGLALVLAGFRRKRRGV